MLAHHLFNLDISVLEKVLRTVLIYLGLAILLRVFGRRDLAQLNTFDLLVIVLLSNTVQNGLIGPDNSVSGALIGACALFGVNAVVVRFAARSDSTRQLFDGRPVTLVENGQLDRRTMRRLALRPADIEDALHRQGADDLSQVQEAVLATGGTIVVRQHEGAHAATKADLRALEERLMTAIAARTPPPACP